MKKIRNKIIIYILIVCCTGCSTWLRYNYEEAIANLPSGSTVISITNEYVQFFNTNGVYKAYYTTGGKIYEIKKNQ
jgi:hypothetical protein